MTNDGRGRIELQSGDGDAQIVWTPTGLTVYDASSNTAYEATLPASQPDTGTAETPPSLARITDLLTQLGIHATVSGAEPTSVAGTPAYSASVSPKHDGGLLGSVELAWDAVQGVPLRVAVYAQGATEPVLELTATQISYGSVDTSCCRREAACGRQGRRHRAAAAPRRRTAERRSLGTRRCEGGRWVHGHST